MNPEDTAILKNDVEVAELMKQAAELGAWRAIWEASGAKIRKDMAAAALNQSSCCSSGISTGAIARLNARVADLEKHNASLEVLLLETRRDLGLLRGKHALLDELSSVIDDNPSPTLESTSADKSPARGM